MKKIDVLKEEAHTELMYSIERQIIEAIKKGNDSILIYTSFLSKEVISELIQAGCKLKEGPTYTTEIVFDIQNNESNVDKL